MKISDLPLGHQKVIAVLEENPGLTSVQIASKFENYNAGLYHLNQVDGLGLLEHEKLVAVWRINTHFSLKNNYKEIIGNLKEI